MGWAVIMTPPLPDAPKKSPRVYRNLQTKDLEDVTFSDVEATGDPLAIEMHNEDELRRLVLVQLARLTVKSEWTGLLTSSAVSFPLLAPDGSSGAPSYSFTNDTDAGMYLTSAGTLSFTAGGEKLRISSSGLQAIPDGTASTPGISFAGDTQSGLLQPATNNIAIATNANERIRVGDAGQIGIGGANYGTDGQVLTSKGASAAVQWADASGGGSAFGFLIKTPFDSTFKIFQISNFAPFASIGVSGSSTYFAQTRPTAFPFIAPFDGSINDAQLSVSTGQTGAKVNVGIYTLDSNNYPNAKVAEIEFDGSSSGTKSSSSVSQTSDLVAGDPYYYVVWGHSGTVTQATLSAIDDEHTAGIAPGFSLNTAQVPNKITGANLTTGTTLPATFNLTGADGPGTSNRPLFALIQDP
jgi:hypothetical protein